MTLEELVIDVVNAADQANTQDAIENLSPYGLLLMIAVDALRNALNKEKQQTILTSEQARN